MAKEIERKFLVTSSEWESISGRKLYRQGYLTTSKKRVVRVRTVDEHGFITIKSQRTTLTRDEFEYEIPYKDAEFLLNNLCLKPLIEKYRTRIFINGVDWEVDKFIGANEGLIIAEIELDDENQKVILPPWIGYEVSDDTKYYNSNLVKNPYCKWKNS